jgi:ATP-dependent Lon protease
METQSKELPTNCPVLPLRDVVVYPHMVIPLFVGRGKSIKALDLAMEGNKQILLVAQKSAGEDDPKIEEIYKVGTLSNILQMLKLPDGTIKVLVEGSRRVKILEFTKVDEMFAASVELIEEDDIDQRELDILSRSTMHQFEHYIKLNKKVPPEILSSVAGIDEPSRLADTIAAHMAIRLDEKQKILELIDVSKRLEHIIKLMESEIDLLQVEKRIRGRVKSQMEKSQREYYLNEQMKAIQKELGEMEDVPNEIDDLTQKIEKSGMPKDTRIKASSELNKLKMMSPMSAEATVVRNYLDWLVSVPWK